MKLYRKIDTNGFFIEDVLLNTIPFLTETITETITLEDNTIQEVAHEVIVMQDVLDETGAVVGQEPVTSPYYIETPCPQGFYKPKWDGVQWVEGGTIPTETAEQEIARLKIELEDTDYKIIKCSEYQLVNLESPYNILTLHTERQVIRDRINELETQ